MDSQDASIQVGSQKPNSKINFLRGQCKSVVTRCINFLNKTENVNAYELHNRKKAIEEAYSKYNRLAEEAVEQGQDVPNDDEEFEEKYFSTLSRIDALLVRGNTSVTEFSSALETSTPVFEHARLPPIEIQSFDGSNVGAYKPFIELYMALIGNNVKLSNIQKLFYLKGYLQGEALDLINNLPLINQSYDDAISLLNRRYDTKGLLIKSHINNLLDLPMSQVSQQKSALKSYGQPVESWDSLLVCIIMRKLDTLTVRLFNSEQDFRDMPSLESLLSFLERRAISLEASLVCDQNRSAKASSSKSYHVTNNSNKNPNTDSVVNPVKPKPIGCLLCKNECHKLYKCPTFLLMTVSNRLAYVKENNLCSICLNTHSQKCRYNFSCSFCKQQSHNSLLHKNTSIDSSQCTESTAAHSIHNKDSQILLPTVKIAIQGPNNKRVIVRALLDSGSQTSFCAQSLVDKLGLKTYNCSKNILTLGQNSKRVQKAVDLQLDSLSENYSINISCSVVDQITTLLPQCKMNINNFIIPSSLKLADTDFHIPGEVSLLLASDIFFKILKDGKVEGGSMDPVLINTRFGYIVSGCSGDSEPLFLSNSMSIALHSQLTPDLEVHNLVKNF
ncbi:hypothetical protein ABMA27_008944 [Loxostege sticticalis]|uniref:Peptidase aspartic putative domain-containing protein n=1 Tax=Loxostege sticticalis TaxID=481309 RepID=A0ABR3H9D4_LOXSC